MNRFLIALVFAAILLTACGDAGPSLFVSNVQVVAPAPGRAATVAYLSIDNSGGPTELTGISSPDFARAELHSTTIAGGVARMESRSRIAIAEDSMTELAPGGLHIMLFDPHVAPVPGKMVSLHLEFSSGELLVVDAPLATRIDVD